MTQSHDSESRNPRMKHAAQGAANIADEHGRNHADHHITPFNVYMKVAIGLFVLTFLTVGFHALRNYLGSMAPLVAFTIAAVKAYLVMAYFMHLKYESLMNRLIFATGFFFLALLYIISILDILTRNKITLFS